MSDIVERLRKWSVFGYGYEASCDMKEAATYIEIVVEDLLKFRSGEHFLTLNDHIAMQEREIARLLTEVKQKIRERDHAREISIRYEADNTALRAQNAELVEALRQLARYSADEYEMDWADTVLEMNAIARAALAKIETPKPSAAETDNDR